MASLTVYPDPDPETTSVDGVIYTRGAGGESWATVRSTADGDTATDNGATGVFVGSDITSGPLYGLFRGFTLFDTSALPDGATITDVTISLYVNTTYNTDNDGNDWVNVFQASTVNNTSIVIQDFDTASQTLDSPVELSTRRDISSGITTGAYNDWVLNADGITTISKTGITKFGWREGHDVINETPAQLVDETEGFNLNFAESAGTTTDPRLVVTYSEGAPKVIFF